MPEPNEKLIDALAAFAAGAGHEINNPLAIISGHAQILLADAETLEEKRHLAAIIAQVKRAYEMITDLRTFSRPPEPVFAEVDLKAFFEELVNHYSSPSLHVNIAADWKSLKDFRNTVCDPQILRSVFDALIKNATEGNEGEENPKRTVNIQPGITQNTEGGTRWSIAVEDDGPGIPAEADDRLFFPYFSGREFGRGLGFGLPRSWALMKKMGGNLILSKEEGKTRFLVEFPVHQSSQGESQF